MSNVRLSLVALPVLAFGSACADHPQQSPPPQYAAPPVAVTSAPAPSTPPAPPPLPPGGDEPHHGGSGGPGGSGMGMHHPMPGGPGGEGPSHGMGPGPMRDMREQGHVYKLDFVLTAKEGATATPTTFTLTLLEGNHGEVHIGKNVPLATAAPSTGAGAGLGGPRQDVGLKVRVQYRTVGDDVLLEVSTELSALEGGGSIRKVTAQGNALASAGKASPVVSLDEDKKHYELTVTPTKLR